MKRLLVFCAALVACGGSNAPSSPIAEGPLKLGIVSGQNQVAIAGSSQLSAPVVGKLVREPNGTVAFIQTSASRALDLVVPRAFAQGTGTVVTGSPVPNAVVCAVSVDTAHSLVPFTPCTNTDSAGTATFYFTPGHGAGIAKAEIRGTLNAQPAVFDTAKATVLPAAPMWLGWTPAGLHDTVNVGDTLDLHRLVGHVRDQYYNFIAPASAADVSANGLADTTTTWTPTYAVRDGSEGSPPSADATGWKWVVRLNPTGQSQAGANGYSHTLYIYFFANGAQLHDVLTLTVR